MNKLWIWILRLVQMIRVWINNWWPCWWSWRIFCWFLKLFQRNRFLRSRYTVRSFIIIKNYIAAPVNNGMLTPIEAGIGSLLAFWRFLTYKTPAGNPKITPYQKPFYYVLLKCSKATFIAETSYESYLKSDISFIELLW